MMQDDRDQMQEGTGPWGRRPRPPEKQPTPAARRRPPSPRIKTRILAFLFILPLLVLGGGCNIYGSAIHQYFIGSQSRQNYIADLLPMTIFYILPFSFLVIPAFFLLNKIIYKDPRNIKMLSYFGYAIIFQNIFYFYPFYIVGPEKILHSPSIMAVIAFSTMLALFLIFASLFAKNNILLRKSVFFSISLFLNSIYLIFIGVLLLIFNYTIFTSPFVDYTKGYNTPLYYIPISITYLSGTLPILFFMSIAKALSGGDRNKKYDNYSIAFSLVFNISILWASFLFQRGRVPRFCPPWQPRQSSVHYWQFISFSEDTANEHC